MFYVYGKFSKKEWFYQFIDLYDTQEEAEDFALKFVKRYDGSAYVTRKRWYHC